MKTKPDFKFGDQVVFIGDRQKRGVVSRVFRSGGLWWLAFEGEPDWRTSRDTSSSTLLAAKMSAPGVSFRKWSRVKAWAGDDPSEHAQQNAPGNGSKAEAQPC